MIRMPCVRTVLEDIIVHVNKDTKEREEWAPVKVINTFSFLILNQPIRNRRDGMAEWFSW